MLSSDMTDDATCSLSALSKRREVWSETGDGLDGASANAHPAPAAASVDVTQAGTAPPYYARPPKCLPDYVLSEFST
jgi:hypothetical protein